MPGKMGVRTVSWYTGKDSDRDICTGQVGSKGQSRPTWFPAFSQLQGLDICSVLSFCLLLRICSCENSKCPAFLLLKLTLRK